MKVTIRKGQPTDVPEVYQLIKELAEFEKAPDAVTNTMEFMLTDGFGEKPVYHLMVAEIGNKIIGMAIYYLKYSTWKGKGVFLEDLIVTESYRGNGIGKQLFQAVIEFAHSVNAVQMHWQVLEWNETAINFYKKYNSEFDATWIDCKLNTEQLKAFAKTIQ